MERGLATIGGLLIRLIAYMYDTDTARENVTCLKHNMYILNTDDCILNTDVTVS